MRVPSPTWVDLAGTTAAVACAIHCALPAVFALISPWIASDDRGEWLFPLLSTLLGAVATIPTWVRTRNPLPMLLWIVGLAMVVAALLAEEGAPGGFPMPMLVASGLMLAAAHAANHRIRGNASFRHQTGACHRPGWRR